MPRAFDLVNTTFSMQVSGRFATPERSNGCRSCSPEHVPKCQVHNYLTVREPDFAIWVSRSKEGYPLPKPSVGTLLTVIRTSLTRALQVNSSRPICHAQSGIGTNVTIDVSLKERGEWSGDFGSCFKWPKLLGTCRLVINNFGTRVLARTAERVVLVLLPQVSV